MTIVLDDDTPKDFKPLIESSTYRSYKAYVDAGFEKDIPRSIETQYQRENKFLSAVQLDKGPLTRKILRMVRRKEDDGKEYFTYTENWYGTDWANREIPPVTDNTQGLLQLPKVEPVIDEKGQRIGKKLNGSTPKYEFLFSKDVVDKLIEETGTNKEQIIFTVRTSNRRDNCNYDQFVYPWNQAVDILMKDGGFEADYVDRKKDKDTSQQSKPKP